MRLRSLIANLSVGIVLVAAANAQAQNRSPTRYTCVAAKKQAVVGAWDRDGVLIVERPHDQECRFSINGAPAGTPPLERVVAGWELIARGGWTASATFPLDALGNALSAATPYETIAPGLSDAIEKNVNLLFGCFGARDARQAFAASTPDMTCRITPPADRGVLQVRSSPGIEFSTGSAQLQLAMTGRDTIHYLFLPARLGPR
jgi:hypothetical protein